MYFLVVLYNSTDGKKQYKNNLTKLVLESINFLPLYYLWIINGLRFIKKVSSILTKNSPISLRLSTLVAKHFKAIIYIYNSALFLGSRNSSLYFTSIFSDDSWRRRGDGEGMEEDESGVGEAQEGCQVSPLTMANERDDIY